MSSILGISAFYHDSAAAIIIDGEIIAAAQEERFTRKKHDSSYPFNAVEFVLNFSKLKLSEVDQVIFYEKPFLKFERLLETYLAFAPKGFASFCMSMPIWLREKLFQKNLLRKKFREFHKGFDWENLTDVKSKINEELQEIEDASNTYHIKEEVGDLLFTVVNYSRHLGVDPDQALRKANQKFKNRFTSMEKICDRNDISFENLPIADKDDLWEEVKKWSE